MSRIEEDRSAAIREMREIYDLKEKLANAMAEAVLKGDLVIVRAIRRQIEAEMSVVKQKIIDIHCPYPVYEVVVDYDKSVEELTREGKFDVLGTEIRLNSQWIAKSGQVHQKIYLFKFGNGIKSRQVFEKMAEEGFEPINFFELLTLGIAFPDLLVNQPIVALGQTWKCSWGKVAPYVSFYAAEKIVNTVPVADEPYDGGWGANWRFAAVRKDKV